MNLLRNMLLAERLFLLPFLPTRDNQSNQAFHNESISLFGLKEKKSKTKSTQSQEKEKKQRNLKYREEEGRREER